MPSDDTAIGWTDGTWNPVHGCSKVSEGCANCYAERESYGHWGHTDHPWTAEHAEANVTLQDHHLDWPATRPEPLRIFVNSMGDLFHDRVPDDYIHDIFDVIEECPEHAFQALTKHGTENDRLVEWDREHGRWPENLWMGVSVESARRAYRIDQLRETGAATKWISFEPLVERVPEPDLAGIDWVVIGGESGPDDARREMDHAWAREIRDAAKEHGLPVFFKQSSAAQNEQGKRLAEAGEDLNMARLMGAGSTAYRELPALPEAMADARPDLADQVVVP